MVLWNEVSNADGQVLAIPKSSPLGGSAVTEAKAGKDDILGLPSYYWFLPEHNAFATIRFSHSHQSIVTLQHYLKSYAENLSGYRLFNKHDKIIGYKKDKTSDKCSWFRFHYSKKLNKGERKNLLDHPEKITALVRNAELPKAVPDRRSSTTKGVDELRNLLSRMVPRGWVDEDDDEVGYTDKIDRMLNDAGVQKVSVEIPFVADQEMLKFLVEEFDENFDEGGFDRVGFKMKNKGTVWLSASSIKADVDLDLTASRTKLPTAVEIMEAVNKRRAFLLNAIEVDDLSSKTG
ncbi:hypothetical protein DIT71_03290 [Marinobacter vulgaris]|uniref:Uncharacterized protein n=1 Tax=Marinobacter vulgaris TaxID=1928331 RepID=A0A2V3ZLH6_9GAMM|nr:hypothetical protein DIT71_03290 [Marinobacter vulgaris]